MKKTVLFLSIVTAIVAIPLAYANGPWKVLFQDEKKPSQASLEHQSWAIPVGSSSAYLKANVPTGSSVAITVSSFIQQPDYPRNIVLTVGGSSAQIAAGTAVVSGKNIYGKSISENFAITQNQSGATTGSKAFKSVSSVVFPSANGTAGLFSIGVGTKLGVRQCLDQSGAYAFSEVANAYETTRGTMAVNSTLVESNTFSPNGSMDGASKVDLFYVQNFRCYPN